MRCVNKILAVILASSFVFGVLSMVDDTVIRADSSYSLSGTAHVQDVGDCEGSWDEATGILTLGTRGQSRRVEAITINLNNGTGLSGTLQYRVHVQDIGWQEYRNAGEMAGTAGQAKRLEGIEMVLTGDLSVVYSVEYRVHIQDYGDAQGWVSDGALAGTTGESKRLEEVQIRLVKRYSGNSTTVNYRVHRQDYGWENVWKINGESSGTTGESKRLEGIEIHLSGNEYSGGIQYRTHVQNIGWESTWSVNGEMSGTQGMSYRLEAIQIELTGEIASYYDVYYRVHAQDYGWLGWAKNGEESGTSGLSKRLEAIQIVLIRKGEASPGSVYGISSATNAIAVTPEKYIYSSGDGSGSSGSTVVSSTNTDQDYCYVGGTHNWVDIGYKITVEGVTHRWICGYCNAPKSELIPNTIEIPDGEPVLIYTSQKWAIKPYWPEYYECEYDPVSYTRVIIDGNGNVVVDTTDETRSRAYESAIEWLAKDGISMSVDDLNDVSWLYSVEYYYSDGSVKTSELDYYVVYELVEANWIENEDYNGYSAEDIRNMITILGISKTVYAADGTLLSTDKEEVVDDMYARTDAFLDSIGYRKYGRVTGYWGYAIEIDYFYKDGSVQAQSGVYRNPYSGVYVPESYVHTLIKQAQA